MNPSLDAVRSMCSTAVADGVTPGLVLLGARAGQPVFHEAFGCRQLVPKRLPTSTATLYDVASLTKAIVTSVLVMQEVAAGRWHLDLPVVEMLPELATPDDPARAAMTVRDLLCHASGLPAHRPFWRQAAAAPSERRAVALLAAREPLTYPPRTRSLYSDLGFILLGWLLERTTGARLDALAAERIARPLALSSTMFLSLSDPAERAEIIGERSIAATQLCPERGRVLLGEVDDLNAMAMGGVAGHAGLFSTAADIATIAAALCRAWLGEDAAAALVDRDVIRDFWTPAGIPGSVWRLGWDGPAEAGSQAGRRIARTAVGHLAFTGCSLWIDPARETWVVLLSNRVHPSIPTDDRFRRFRPAVHDALLDGLGYPA